MRQLDAARASGGRRRELARITARTLVMIGDHDFVRIPHAELVCELIPQAQLAVLPGTTHMQLCQRVELLVPMIDTLLGPG